MLNKKAYSEVYSIINMMSESLKNKIPQTVLIGIENNSDKEYSFIINDIKEFKISKKAEEILAVLYRRYFATDEEKKIIEAKEFFLKNNKIS